MSKNLMKKNAVSSNGVRYISDIPEFKYELPIGILNKKKADVGGTFAVLNYPINYILVVPSLSLLSSIMNDKNVPYNVFDVKGGTDPKQLYKYLKKEKVHKVAVTYDSFPKLIRWLKFKCYDLNNYKVLIDEFHILLQSYGFRNKAIDDLLKTVKDFNHVTYMSATPISDDFISGALGYIPYTSIDWGKETTIKIVRFETNSTKKSIVKIIQNFESDKGFTTTDINGSLTSVKELYIFANTVKDIASIIKTANLDSNSVKVVCSDKIRNKTILKEINVEISEVSDQNKKINFFTSKAFQGCNIFTNNGLVIAVSTGTKKHTLIDVNSSLYQIHGRLRLNSTFQNVFRHILVHIYSIGYKETSDKDFNLNLNENIKKSKDLISAYNRLQGSEKNTIKLLIDDNPYFTDYEPNNDIYHISKLKINFAKYQHNLHNYVYKSGLNLEKSYNKQYFDVESKLTLIHMSNEIELKLALSVNFKTLLKEYILLKSNGEKHLEIEKYELEYPIFKNAYEELGHKGISSCNYSEKKIKSKLESISPIVIETAHKALYDRVGEGNFISVADTKVHIIKIYDKMGIDINKIGFTAKKILGRDSPYDFEHTQRRVENRTVNGFKLSINRINMLSSLI